MDLESLVRLTALPWTIQIVLASGYCAYLIAYVGIRYNHKATDTIFASLAFGLVALLVISIPLDLPVWLRGLMAFFASVVAGVLWRTMFRVWLRKAASKLRYSWSDDTPNAWDRLFDLTDHGPTQITIELNDGRYLLCSDADRVGELPFGPYVLGTTGDILMYVDRTITADGELRDASDNFNSEWGDMVTYIPREQVKKVAIRLKSLNPRAEEEAGWKAWVRAVAAYLRRRRRSRDPD